MKKEEVGKEVRDVQISDLIKPMNNKVLVELIFEGDTYGDTGILKLDSENRCEPYVKIASTPYRNNSAAVDGGDLVLGDLRSPMQIGEYAITRKELPFNSFEMYGKYYALIDEYDIHAVITQEVVDQIKSNVVKATNKNKIQIVN